MTDTETDLLKRYELMRDFLLGEIRRERESALHLAIQRIETQRENAALQRENDQLKRALAAQPLG